MDGRGGASGVGGSNSSYNVPIGKKLIFTRH